MSEMNHLWSDVYFLIPNWKWLFLVFVITLGLFLRPILQGLLCGLKDNRRLQNLHPLFTIFLNLKIESGISWLLLVLFWHFGIIGLELTPKFERVLTGISDLILYFYSIRLAYLAVEAIGQWLDGFVKKTENTLDDQLVPFATKTLKVFVIIFGFLIILQNFGFNVMSLLAGLGLGGLALALAAQDTAANLFGSITLILDHPFQVGDWIKVGDTEGTVEEIGFRSTRIRTFYRSLISVPNSVMAKEKIDNMGARPTRRIRHTLGLTCDTPNLKIQQYAEHLRYYLTQQPYVMKEDITVHFTGMGDFSLQILVQFFVRIDESVPELQIQEDFLLEAKKIAEKLVVNFAYPTQTLQISKPS